LKVVNAEWEKKAKKIAHSFLALKEKLEDEERKKKSLNKPAMCIFLE